MEVYFQYGEKEIEHLKKADKKLAEVIEKVGTVKRKIIPDLFSALVNSIIGQQISTKAHQTIWERMKQKLGDISPAVINDLSPDELQKFGITFKKAAYIQSAARKIISGEFNIQELATMSDEGVCDKLSELDGIGTWTAEMLMLHSMQRPDILSYGDLAIIRGLRMIYHHRSIDKTKFERYKKRYSPYASVASLYIWAVAGGAIENMKDYESKKRLPMKTEEKSKTTNAGKRPYEPGTNPSNIIQIQRYHSPCGDLMLGSFEGKLCLCDWAVEKHRDIVDIRLRKILQADYEEKTSDVIRETGKQLDEYFNGERTVFDIPLFFAGTDFQKKVWHKLLEIPYGTTISYGELAAQLGMPKAVRAVANANGANAISIIAPCHRVIGSDHSLTGYGGGLAAKKLLLDLEINGKRLL